MDARWFRVGAAPKVKLAHLPPVTFVWEMQAYNWGGLAGWSKVSWGPSGPQMYATKAQFCAQIKQLPILQDNPAVILTAKTSGGVGGLIHPPWKGQLSIVLQQIGCF